MPDIYLFVINSLGAGGAEKSLVDLMSYVRSSGIRPVVAVLDRAEQGYEEEAKNAGHRIELVDGSTRFSQIFAIRRLIRSLQPVLIHTSLFDADIVGRLAAAGTRIPVVTTLVNTAYEPIRREDPAIRKWRLALVHAIDSWTARHLTTRFHAISYAVKQSAIRDLSIPAQNITVIERGRDVESLGDRSDARRSEVRQREGLSDDAFVFISVGRHEYQKNHALLIRAFGQLVLQPESVLLVAGREGMQTSRIRDLVKSFGLDSRVRLLGHRSDVADLLAAADVFVFPSLYEGLGGAVIEAMALGLPIIASDIPAMRELGGQAPGIVFVPVGELAALAQAMSDIVTADREALGASNREEYLSRFQAAQANERLVALLRRVAASGRIQRQS